ncbi:hypothetical protein IU459_20165 [Nocardia amamiensis]|uniref:Uncharacterized protein n=1 Tax=Nocardia amamiensis TaxID=404578 RepID=A0ABS0CUK8_9NOCA|nr:hypothetical protein [Nocardia amamiensis]MBF6299840.1 hypothetical protein [Nocardia amamiensis]
MNAGNNHDDDGLRVRESLTNGSVQFIGPDGFPRTPEEHAEILEDEAIDRAYELLDTRADGAQ